MILLGDRVVRIGTVIRFTGQPKTLTFGPYGHHMALHDRVLLEGLLLPDKA